MIMKCPNCGCDDLSRDEVDVGIGIICGPYGCECGWSESDAYNQLLETRKPRTDQYGGYYPEQVTQLKGVDE